MGINLTNLIKKLAKTGSNPAEMRTMNIPNTACHRSINQLSERCVKEPVILFLTLVTNKPYKQYLLAMA
jgi:hypothetical protein